MALRVMFQVQQMTFQWIRKRRTVAHGTAVPAPDFGAVTSGVEAFLMSGVPELPVAWNNLIREEDNIRCREPERLRGGAGNGGGGNEPQD